MDFKLLTGLRRGDILSIKLNQLKDDGIHVTISKTRKEVIFEWSEALRQAVKNIRQLKQPVTGLTLFKNPSRNTLYRLWVRLNLVAANDSCNKRRNNQGAIHGHDIRAKAASDTDKEHATKLLTHLDSKTTERIYRRKKEKIKPLEPLAKPIKTRGINSETS